MFACKAKTDESQVNLGHKKTDSAITLDAKNIPLSKIISRLEKEYSVQVVIPDFEDRNISIFLQEQSLHDAIRALLPENKLFWIIAEKDLWSIDGNKGDKTGKKYRPESDKKKKNPVETEPKLVGNKGARLKPAPDKITLSKITGGKGRKVAPQKSIAREAKGLKLKKKEKVTETADYYIRMRFRVENGKFTLEKTLQIPGQFIASNTLRGHYIYRLFDGDKTLATGSFRDPMEMHSYPPEPDMPHHVLYREVGFIDIDMPASIRQSKKLEDSTMEFYRITAEPTERVLSPETFNKFEKFIKKTDSLSGKTFYKQITNPVIQKQGE